MSLEVAGLFPAKCRYLFEPHRYKVLYGGRGGAKSWSIARALLIQGTQRKLRILCAREIQNSIAESVHQLLVNQIKALGLEAFYTITKTEIRGANGTVFTYAGLRHNIDNIRSKEGIDIVWVEEAHIVSDGSWKKLIPTIRRSGSEIWISFNPELNTDATYRRFVLQPPSSAAVVKMNWRDNPWFPDVLHQEMLDLKESNYDEYLHVWEGHCTLTVDGAIFAHELRAATAQNRITRVPWVPGQPVHTFWDLGRSDLTAIWFLQLIAGEVRCIDYYENSGYLVDHYLKELGSKPYVYGVTWLPHDANEKRMVAKKNIKQQVQEKMKDVRVIPRVQKKVTSINAARTVFPDCWFDEEKCSDGLDALRHYQYKVSEITGQRSKEPFHNWASNGSDAFQGIGLALKPPAPPPEDVPEPAEVPESPQSWMS